MTQRHRRTGVIAVAGLLALASGCSQDAISGQAQTAAPTLVSSTAGVTSPPTPTRSSSAFLSTQPAPKGPNGAPFDPCTIVGWVDIATGGLTNPGPDGPAQRASAPEALAPRDGYKADCRVDNTIIEIPLPGDPNNDPNDTGGNTYWITHVLWADTCTGCNPNTVLGREGRVILKDRSGDTRTPSDQCVVTAKIVSGYASVSVFDERWKAADPDTCARANEILGHVVDRVS